MDSYPPEYVVRCAAWSQCQPVRDTRGPTVPVL